MNRYLTLVPDDLELDLSPPPELTTGLFRSLLGNIKDLVAPEKLPPLHLTSKPLNVGMPVGDLVARPWFRTVFTNIGDVVSPEVLPPMENQSAPVDVGELIADQLQHPWWASLLRSLADKVAPERLPAMQLTSVPVNPENASHFFNTPKWSEVIEGPKIFYPDAPKENRPFNLRPAPVVEEPEEEPVEMQPEFQEMIRKARLDLKWARMREAVWISCAVAEVALIVVFALKG